ncbi:MAG: hypothetical protein AAGF95_34225 [Chloroflexota bacterium]
MGFVGGYKPPLQGRPGEIEAAFYAPAAQAASYQYHLLKQVTSGVWCCSEMVCFLLQ